MEMRRHPGDSARQYLAAFSHEFLEQIRIFVVDGFCGNIDATAGHDPVRPSEIRSAFGIFRFHCLLHLPMKGASAKEGIVLFFLEPAWRIWAFLVTRADVTRGRFAFRFRLRALESNDFPWHDR